MNVAPLSSSVTSMPTVIIHGAPTVAPVKLVLLAMGKNAQVSFDEHLN